jgi:PAS domain S-box-containing protein
VRRTYVDYVLDLLRDGGMSTLEYCLEEAQFILANAKKLPVPLDYVNEEEHFCMLVERDGRIVYANSLACRLFGRVLEKLRGRCLFALVPRERAKPRLEAISAVVESGRMCQYLDHDGSGHWYDTRYLPLKENGTVKQVVILAMPLNSAPEPLEVRIIE